MMDMKVLTILFAVTSVHEFVLPTSAAYTSYGGVTYGHHNVGYGSTTAKKYGYKSYGYSKPGKFVPAGSISETDYLLKKLKSHARTVLNYHHNVAKAHRKADSVVGKQLALQSLAHYSHVLGKQAAGLAPRGAGYSTGYGGHPGYRGPDAHAHYGHQQNQHLPYGGHAGSYGPHYAGGAGYGYRYNGDHAF